MNKKTQEFQYPGTRAAMDGNTAVIMVEREASDAAGAYPITPSTQMGEYWAEETSKGHVNVSGRPLIFIEPESEHAAAGVTAGMAMSGLRATNFSSAQGVAFMHESLYAAAGKRLPYLLNIGCRAITKATLNVHAAHDDYHCIDDTGFFQVMGKSNQEACDLNLVARKIAELALSPGAVAQDGFLTTHLIESMRVPERELVSRYLGRPDDQIDTPTPAQRLIYGDRRRRIPALWDVDNPVQSGVVQNQDAYMQAVAAQRPYFYDHIPEITDRCMEEFYELTGRRYRRVSTYRCEDADYLIVGMGSVVSSSEAVTDYLRESRGLKVGVVNLTMFRPFPGELLGHILKGKKGVVVLERTDQPLAEDLPVMREVRAALSKCLENQVSKNEEPPYPNYAVFAKGKDMPPLYSGCFGLGSRDLQPEGIIGAVENMLPDGARKRFFYLSVDFVRDGVDSPKVEIYRDQVLEAYPGVRALAVHGSENPNLMPKDAITVRFHSVGGWGAMTTGKNLAMTLFDLLDFDIKANPKYGSEKKGQPTTYYLTAAPEPIRVNCEYIYVDVVLSPDPNVFHHSNALNGLKRGGVFIIQSHLDSPQAVWETFPPYAQRYIADNDIRVYYVDGFRIAREEATNPELQFRMQGIAFQGAFFAASPVMRTANLTEDTLFAAIRDQLQDKFGSKGARVVEDNLRVVRRGFDEIHEITDKQAGTVKVVPLRKETSLPVLLKAMPGSEAPATDIHRFWEQTGNFYVSGQGADNPADPFMAMSLIPAATGVFRDMTQIRFEHPDWLAEKCTGCGDCYTVCPDSAIPGLVNSVGEVLATAVKRVSGKGREPKHLPRAVRAVEKQLHNLLAPVGEGTNVRALIRQAIHHTLETSELQGPEREALETELSWLQDALGSFRFALTKPYHSVREKRAAGSGGLLSITVNPYTCKGCMECVAVCDDDALVAVEQTEASVQQLRRDWKFWMDLPSTSPDYVRVDDLDEKIGALETLLLEKSNYQSMVCGDGACIGCGEKTVIHLFTSTVTALMQPRVKRHVERLNQLISDLEQHVRLKLADTMDLSDPNAILGAVEQYQDADLTLARLAGSLDGGQPTHPINPDWLQWVTQLLATLKTLRWQYTHGTTGQGRAEMGIINATGCTSVWGSTFPFNPYPFPWSSHLFQDTPSVAMGVFEGHMAKMAEGFKAIRMADKALADDYDKDKDEEFFTHFDWRQFTDEEFRLCPPVVAVGGDGALYDIGFQNLSRMMMSGMPIKALVLDTQVYSNTGGQACTSGFLGQVSDMAPFGPAWKGKREMRKEMGLVGMAHRGTFVLQGTIAHVTHLLEGYIDGLNSRHPALFNVYAVCQPEHGVGDDASEQQSRLAVESRAYPLFRYDPEAGADVRQAISLDGNPARAQDWPTYQLAYVDEGGEKATMDLPMTFADFALTEGRFRKHFRKAPRDAWNDDMVPLAEFIELALSEREGRFPYIWAVDAKNHLMRVLVSAELVASTEERRDYWRLLESMTGREKGIDLSQVISDTRAETVRAITAGLMNLAAGGEAGAAAAGLPLPEPPAAAEPATAQTPAADASAGDFEPVWIETSECTSCDECVELNPNIFAYDENTQAYVKDPKGGPFADIVKAAEKCTAGVIHPGTPSNSNEKDLEKLIQRAAKYQ